MSEGDVTYNPLDLNRPVKILLPRKKVCDKGCEILLRHLAEGIPDEFLGLDNLVYLQGSKVAVGPLDKIEIILSERRV